MELSKLLNVELISVIVGAIFTLAKTFKFIQEGERGLKLRFGKVVKNRNGEPKVIEPGFTLLIPYVESLVRHHVRQQTVSLRNQRIMTSDHLIFNVSAMVNFRVNDIYKALFEIDDLDDSLTDLSMAILRDILSKKSYRELSDMEKISKELLEELKQKSEEWGVEFVQFKLTDCAPTAETSHIVTAETGVELKLSSIITALQKRSVPVDKLSPQFFSVLMGNPLVTNVGSSDSHHNINIVAEQKGFFARLLEGATGEVEKT